MKKRKIIFIFAVALFVSLMVFSVFAEKIGIEVNNNYIPGENVSFKITLYDDSNNKLNSELDFVVQNYFRDVFQQGKINSGESLNFKLPENAERGYWAIIGKYKDISNEVLFNVGELEKADIKLEDSYLVITNIGNVHYGKTIQISIGDYKETAIVPLEIGQSKRIRLTAPDGNYEVRVNDGAKEDIVFTGVGLTGNAIGLERVVDGGFWKQYPLISLFLFVLVLVIVAVVSIRLYRGYFNRSHKGKAVKKRDNS